MSSSEVSLVGVSSGKRGRPVRSKVVKEVEWLSSLSEGVEECRELELLVVGDGVGFVSAEKNSEALALKEKKIRRHWL